MITNDQIVQQVRVLADESPNHVYQAQQGFAANFHRDENDEPIPGSGCIVGQALQRLGVGYDDIPQHGGIMSLMNRGLVEDDDDRVWLLKVQNSQDDGVPWGNAVSAADRWLGWQGLTLAP